MAAQKSGHDRPPGMAVVEQFMSWHAQYVWQAAELELPVEPALELPALELPALELPALELPALEPVEPLAPADAPLAPVLVAPLAPPVPALEESLELQPNAAPNNDAPIRTSALISFVPCVLRSTASPGRPRPYQATPKAPSPGSNGRYRRFGHRGNV
jgi:hypothetical protein